MKKTLTTLLLLCMFSWMGTHTQAQNGAIHITTLAGHDHQHDGPGRNCQAHTVLQEKMQADPVFERRMRDMEEKTQMYMREYRGSSARNFSRVIPVYVHVIYRTSQENISDNQIQSQIDQLNADFAATNSDYGTSNPFNSVKSGNTGISFTLAGVTRTQNSKTSWGTNDDMKNPARGGVAPVTPATHLNVWVCNIGGGILGYAQFPGGSSATDGVVIAPQYFGSRRTSDISVPTTGFYLSAPYDGGRTTTHEVGHYLNLSHIWGDGDCNADDFVDDTPIAGQSNGGCPSPGTNTCPGGQDDMYMNYMDYVNDACMYMFSNGQRLRMEACLNSTRTQLGTTGSGSGSGGGSTTCYTTITLSITTDNYASETSWTIKNAAGTTVKSGSGYASNATVTPDVSGLAAGNYTFTINDSYGDGICCSYGNGSYTLSGDGSTIDTDASFGSSKTVSFCVQGGSSGGGSCTPLNVTNSFESTFDGWSNDSGDDFDWTRRSGGTPSGNTGPSSASAGSNYIYMESSSPNYSTKNAIITSASQNLIGTCNPTVTFSYHMYGASNMGSLSLQVSVDNGSWSTIWSESGNQGNSWQTANVNLNNYKGSNVRFRFNGTTGTTWRGDMAVDNFRLNGASSARQASPVVVEAAAAPEVSLFPNPAQNTINAELTNVEQNLMGRIMDATGRTLWMGQLEAGQNSINISSLPVGLYYFTVVQTTGEVMTKKFVKQ